MEEIRGIDFEKIRKQMETMQENMRELMEKHRFSQQLWNEEARKAWEEARNIHEERIKDIQRSLEESRLEKGEKNE